MRVIPSIREIGDALATVLRRFSPVVVSALGGMVCAMVWVERSFSASPAVPAKLSCALMTFVLAVPGLFSLCLYRERFLGRRAGILVVAAGCGLAAFYYLGLRGAEVPLPGKQLERFLLLWAGLHFLVAVAPYAGRTGSAGFWRYNERLFLRFLLGAFYSYVLYMGLAVAILSLEKLLGLRVRSQTYTDLGILLAGGFHPLFFLAGVPQDFSALEAGRPHPTALRRFVQFVLIPLVVVYLAILYLYAGKIVLTWDLPKGWLAWPVLILAVIGIFAALLLEPLENDSSFRWAGAFRRWFYRLLLPLVALLLLAIGRRIHDYGVTEGRYLAVVVAVWLAAVGTAFARTRGPTIKVIPWSLAISCCLSAIGPWDAFAVSYRDQWSRLERQLQAAGALNQGRLAPGTAHLDARTSEEVSSEVDYLLRIHSHAAVDGLMAGLPGWQPYDPAWSDTVGYSDHSGSAFLRVLGVQAASFSAQRPFHLRLAEPGIVVTPAGARVSHQLVSRFTPNASGRTLKLLEDGSLVIDASDGLAGLRLVAGDKSLPIGLVGQLTQLAARERMGESRVRQDQTAHLAADRMTWRGTLGGHAVALVVIDAYGSSAAGNAPQFNSIEFFAVVAAAP